MTRYMVLRALAFVGAVVFAVAFSHVLGLPLWGTMVVALLLGFFASEVTR